MCNATHYDVEVCGIRQLCASVRSGMEGVTHTLTECSLSMAMMVGGYYWSMPPMFSTQLTGVRCHGIHMFYGHNALGISLTLIEAGFHLFWIIQPC